MSEKNQVNGDIAKEIKALTDSALTVYNEDSGHYSLLPQRSAFLRCDKCINLCNADCHTDENGDWVWNNECLFCVQRAIDMLGFYEHKITPALSLHDTPKSRERLGDTNDLYSILSKVAQNPELMKGS